LRAPRRCPKVAPVLIALLAVIGLAVVTYGFALVRAGIVQRAVPNLEAVVLGAVVNFFDALGIGSFAPTTAWFKFRRMVPDRLIPQTMLCGLTPPAMTESIVYLILLGVLVDPALLFGCSMALFAGGLVGVRLVVRSKVWIVQAIVAVGLLLAATAYALDNLHILKSGGGTASSLPPSLTIIAIIANFGLGILANFGVGNFAPSLVMFSLMGMNPKLAFPIMAGGASLMGAGASFQHIRIGQVNLRIVLGLAIGGIPAVLVAALIVKSMPIETLRWLVFAVVLYAAAVMGHAAFRGRREGTVEAAEAPLVLPVEAEAGS
jgi:uncharacterized membrane protein YfcA